MSRVVGGPPPPPKLPCALSCVGVRVWHRTLAVSGCLFTSVFASTSVSGMGALTSLDVSSNLLTAFPTAVTGVPNLRCAAVSLSLLDHAMSCDGGVRCDGGVSV